MNRFAAPRDEPEEWAAILVVDDGRADRLMLSEILAGPKRHVDAVGTGKDALKCLLVRDYAVILLDVLMPQMDGFELASLIRSRQRTRQVPIIFLTAAGDDVRKLYRAYALGAVDYLNKPIDADIVRAKVAIFVELHRKDVRLRQQARELQVAERRERELQIAELKLAVRQRYVNLAEAIPQIVWTSDSSGAMDYANRRWEQYTGLCMEQSRGSGWLQAIHLNDAVQCTEAWRKAIESGTALEVECRLLRAIDQSYRWHLCRAVPEFDGEGHLVAWLGTFTDFEELRQAVVARDEFISIASHELRTPLTALKLRLDAMSLSASSSDDLRRRLDSAMGQTVRLERLIENLLDVSRISSEQLDLRLEPVDLAEVASEAVERLFSEAQRHGCQLTFQHSGNAVGRWDRLRLDQVITNIMSNAIKYGNGGDILVSVSADDTRSELLVRDEGIGISERDKQRIFGLFERGTNRRNQVGLGMGLYIASQIVKAHGGAIRVQSQLGTGSEFRVTLPKGRLEEQKSR